jgi:hypothetical protein
VTDCHELRMLYGAAVLGALESEEAAMVRAHVASCPACAAEYTRLAPLPALLTLAAGAEAAAEDPPPPALEERLLDAVAAEGRVRPRRRRRWLRRPRLALAGGLGAAVLAAGIAAIVLIGGEGESPDYDVTLHATAAAPRGHAWAELQQVEGGTSMHLWVNGLPADRAAVYEVHCDAPEWSATAGTFRVDAEGKAYVVLNTAARADEYDAIHVVRSTDDRVVFSARLAN